MIFSLRALSLSLDLAGLSLETLCRPLPWHALSYRSLTISQAAGFPAEAIADGAGFSAKVIAEAAGFSVKAIAEAAGLPIEYVREMQRI